jgi:hypothetical protein
MSGLSTLPLLKDAKTLVSPTMAAGASEST